mgnify:CR=1 FL=1
MSIQVTGCRILIRPLKVEEVDEVVKSAKSFGIQLLDQDERKAKIAMEKGTLLQLGPKVSEEYTAGAQVGDVVGFTKFGGKFIKEKESDEELLVVNDEDILCVFKETK